MSGVDRVRVSGGRGESERGRSAATIHVTLIHVHCTWPLLYTVPAVSVVRQLQVTGSLVP